VFGEEGDHYSTWSPFETVSGCRCSHHKGM
jgi:hypothetical protein